MSYYEIEQSITLEVASDQSANQYKFMILGSTGIALNTVAGGPCLGVLQTNDADALGKRATVGVYGVMKVEASDVIAKGAQVTSTALGLAVTAGAEDRVQGTALEAAAAAGDIIAVLLVKDQANLTVAGLTLSTVMAATVASFISSAVRTGNIIKTTIVIDLTGAKSTTTDLDIIGDTGVCYIGQVTEAINGSIFAGQVGCSVVPTTGADDIDLYSALEDTGAYDADVTGLTEKVLMTSGAAHAIGTIKPFTVLPAADDYLYLVAGEAGTPGTYDAGTLVIELWGTVV